MTCTYTPQQDGPAGLMNRAFLGMVRSVMAHKNLHRHFWGDAVVPAAYFRNRVTCPGLSKITTLFQVWFGEKTHLTHLQVLLFCCLYHSREEETKKLRDHGAPAMLIGYPQNQEAHKLWDSKSVLRCKGR